ncbi:MAG: GerMN domain-containing protein [Patescibacteria group bacterium]
MKKPLILLIILVVVISGWLAYRKYVIDAEPSDLITSSPVKTDEQQKEIEVFLPTTNTTTVGTKFVIYGKGRAFENTLNYRISDGAGKQLFFGHFMTNSPEAGVFGYFHQEVDLAEILKIIPANIRLDVFEASAKDGADIHKTSFDFKVDSASTSIFAYFFNNNLDPDVGCDKTFAVSRVVPKTAAILRAALEELLSGPTSNERKLGFETSITKDVKLNSVKIVGNANDIAVIDLSKDQSGGSCRVGIITSQITNTAKQFDNVKQVIISVNGKTEDILQP